MAIIPTITARLARMIRWRSSARCSVSVIVASGVRSGCSPRRSGLASFMRRVADPSARRQRRRAHRRLVRAASRSATVGPRLGVDLGWVGIGDRFPVRHRRRRVLQRVVVQLLAREGRRLAHRVGGLLDLLGRLLEALAHLLLETGAELAQLSPRAAGAAHRVGQLVRPEDHEGEDQDDDDLAAGQVEHAASLENRGRRRHADPAPQVSCASAAWSPAPPAPMSPRPRRAPTTRWATVVVGAASSGAAARLRLHPRIGDPPVDRQLLVEQVGLGLVRRHVVRRIGDDRFDVRRRPAELRVDGPDELDVAGQQRSRRCASCRPYPSRPGVRTPAAAGRCRPRTARRARRRSLPSALPWPPSSWSPPPTVGGRRSPAVVVVGGRRSSSCRLAPSSSSRRSPEEWSPWSDVAVASTASAATGDGAVNRRRDRRSVRCLSMSSVPPVGERAGERDRTDPP